MIKPPEKLRSFDSLIEVVRSLRNPNGGCPWDLEQTHNSLTPFLIEESHELVEAIESGDSTHIVEELGDVLLQVLLHSVIAEQNGKFSFLDVVEAQNKKLIFRHPHVFGDALASDSAEVLRNWEVLKAEEKAKKSPGQPNPEKFEVPIELPALQRSSKLGAKTKKFKFDWANISEVRQKVQEELSEVDEAIKTNKTELIEDEIGDLLFTVAQLARHANIDPEGALRKANTKFEKRFFKMKALAESRGLKLESSSNQELEALWQEIKRS